MDELSKVNVNGKEYHLKDETARQGSGGYVAYDEAQELTEEQKAQARENIGAAAAGESGGTQENVTLLGTTPHKLAESTNVKLTCDTQCSYAVQSDTVAVFDVLGGTKSKVTVKEVDGHYQIQSDGTSNAWYEIYLQMQLSGLTVGETYTFVFDSTDLPFADDYSVTDGYYSLNDGNGTAIYTKGTQSIQKQTYEFTAATSDLTLVWYPLANGVIGTANVNKIYLNRAGTSELTDVVNMTGSFSGNTTLEAIPAGVTITANPAANVYSVSGGTTGSGSVKSRHEGKVCVCFGDSITGNAAAPSDYPSVIAKETGMKAVNAGFGGCMMSDNHSAPAYAAFSMVKLADAVATGDWSLQDSQVHGLSASTNSGEHLAALKEVNWNHVDFVTIAYGTNDIQAGVGIDNTGNAQDTKTYLGALRYSIARILTAYPHIKMLLLTPVYRYWNQENIDSDSKAFSGKAFTAWGDGLLEVAKEYKIPAVDMYRTLGFNAITRTYYFPSTDGTHPNAKGLKLMGGKIAARLLAEF